MMTRQEPVRELYADELFPDLPSWVRNRLFRDGVRTRAALAAMTPAEVRSYGQRTGQLIAAWQAQETDLCPHCGGTGRVAKAVI